MFARTPRHALLLIAALSGCSADPDDTAGGDASNGGQTGEEGAGCLAVRTERLAASQASPLGFSADQVMAAVGLEHSVPLTWQDGTQTSLRLAFDYPGTEVEFAERQYRASGSDSNASGPQSAVAEIATECNDVLNVPLGLTFATEDGAFDEVWSVTLGAEALTSASLFYLLDLNVLEGSFRGTDFAPAGTDLSSVFLTLSFDAGVLTGSISGTATRQTGTGPDGSVSGQPIAIATF